MHEDDQTAEAQGEIAAQCGALLEEWVDEGWWMGLDICNFVNDRTEVERDADRLELGVLRYLHA